MWKTASLLVGSVLSLLTLGIVMLASTSALPGITTNPLYYVQRQLIWIAVGGGSAIVLARIDYRYWHTLAPYIGLFVAILLGMTLMPGVGEYIGGSRRWLPLGSKLRIQPSEPAKLAMIMMLSWWMCRKAKHSHELIHGLLIPLGILGVYLGLIFLEPDYGTTFLFGAVGMLILFLAGTRFIYLLMAAITGGLLFTLALLQNEERWNRIVAFMNPEKYAQGEAYQLLQGLRAFLIGGWQGAGLGESIQKRYYLPEAHTDFIFAIIGEELGLIATGGIVLLFIVIFICGMQISRRAPDAFGRYLGFGITLMLVIQAMMNIAVVTGCMPTKGLALPFISYGGSSMVSSLAMVGLLINLASNAVVGDAASRAVKDRNHWF